jgi:hypothetical protein
MHMSFVEQLNEAAGRLQSQVRDYRVNTAERARARVRQAADAVAASQRPVRTLLQAGQRLNTLTHDYVEQILVEQSRTVEGLIGDGVERLKRLAQADSAKSLLRLQAELGPVTRERLARDAGKLWQIVTHTGREMRALASETYAELAYGVQTSTKSPARRKTVRKATRRTARARKAH